MGRARWVVGVTGLATALAGGCGAKSARLPGRDANASGADADAPAATDAGSSPRHEGDASPSFDADAGNAPHEPDASSPADAAPPPDPCAGRTDPSPAPPPPQFACVPPAVPRRMVFPLSGLTVTSSRPLLRWVATDDGASDLQICAERTCRAPWLSSTTTASSFAPPADIPPGYWFWRIRAHGGDDTSWTSPWLFRVRRRFAGYQPSANTAAEPFADYDGDGIPDAPLGGTDFNGDGYSDAGGDVVYVSATCAYDEDRLTHIQFGGPAGLAGGVTVSIEKGWDPLWVAAPKGVGDLDGDGYGDFIGLMRYGSYLIGGCGGAPPTRATVLPIECGNCQLTSLEPGDFDGDGRGDYLYLSGGGATVVFGTASELRPGGIGAVDGGWVLDYNYDGYSDVIATRNDRDQFQLGHWLGGPNGLSPDPTPIVQPDVNVAIYGFGDFDGDGYWDRLESTGVAYGGPNSRVAAGPPTVPVAAVVMILDINGDDFDDVFIDGTWFYGSPQGLVPP